MRQIWSVGLLTLLLGLVLLGCQSGDLTVGQSIVVPKALSIQSIDSVTIRTSTVLLGDSFVTSNDTAMLAGQWKDPQTGQTKAQAYGTLLYPTLSVAGTTDTHLDSVVLEMSYGYVYGDSLTPYTLSVHSLLNALPLNKLFYNTDSAAYRQTPTWQTTVLPKPKSRLRQIRLRLPDEMAQSFFAKLKSGQIKDQTTLNAYIPGFAFRNPAGGNTLIGFSAARSGLRLYYHTLEASTTNTNVLFSFAATHFTQFQNDRTGTPLAALRTRTDAVNSRLTGNTSFISLGDQLQTLIEFPYLNQFGLPENFAGVNRALLTVTTTRTSIRDNISPPSYLQLFEANSLNRPIAAVPLGADGSSNPQVAYIYDPTAQLFTDFYTFDITYYFNQLLRHKATNRPLLLTIPNQNYSLFSIIQRVGLGNQQRVPRAMKLQVFITSGT